MSNKRENLVKNANRVLTDALETVYQLQVQTGATNGELSQTLNKKLAAEIKSNPNGLAGVVQKWESE
jgi:hypothetical protein